MSWDRSKPLLIDPLLVFSTYSGSRGDNFGFTATYDTGGHFYSGGIVDNEQGSYPVTVGAFQTTYGGRGPAQAPVYLPCDVAISKYTPNDSPDNTATYTNRTLNIQTKQMNLQMMTQGRISLNCAKVNIRSGLRDAVISVPSGAGGANNAPGGASGVTVLNNCTRAATRVEKLLATASQGSDTTGTVTARVMGFEGSVSDRDIAAARIS
jgi:hypothetical protein